MDPDIKELLEEAVALSKENHRMLKAMRRWQWYGAVGRVLIWAGLIIIPLYVYQALVAPVVPASLDFQKLLESYQAGL